MSGTVLTLRPSGDVATANWTLVGAASHAAALSDNSDASYSQNQGAFGDQLIVESFPGFVIPILSQVRLVTPRYRHRFVGTSQPWDALMVSLLVSDLAGGQHSEPIYADQQWIPTGAPFANYSGGARASDPAGNPWTAVTLQTVRVQMRGSITGPSFWNQLQIAELYLDVYYNQPPLVVATAPTGTLTSTSRPSIQWSYSDPDGDSQERWVIRVFTAATIASLSFNVTNKSLTSNVATIQTNQVSPYNIGDTVTVSGVDATFNGTYLVKSSSSYPVCTFSYDLTHANVASVAATGTVFSPNGHDASTFGFSGEVYSAATSTTLGIDLPNGQYWSYVAAADVGSNGRYGLLGLSTFTIALTPPPPPVLTATYDGANYRNVLIAQAASNLATANQSDVETDATGFTPITLCTLARSTAQASSGLGSLAMTSTGAGTIDASTLQDSGTTGGSWPVASSLTYTAYAELRAMTTARVSRIGIMWFNNLKVWFGTVWGPTASCSNSAWTVYNFNAVSPPTAVEAAVVFEFQGIAAGGEVYYVDKIGMWPGTGTTWTRGGLAGTTNSETIVIESSDDGGTTWTQLTGSPFTPSVYQTVTTYDYTLPTLVARTYRARVTAVDSLGNVLSSVNSSSTSPLTYVLAGPLWRLVDPVTPANSVFVRAKLTDEEAVEQLGVFRPLGRPDAVVVSAGIDSGWGGAITCYTINEAEARALDPVWKARNALWIVSPSGSQNRFIRLLTPRKRPRLGGSLARAWSAPFVSSKRP